MGSPATTRPSRDVLRHTRPAPLHVGGAIAGARPISRPVSTPAVSIFGPANSQFVAILLWLGIGLLTVIFIGVMILIVFNTSAAVDASGPVSRSDFFQP